MNHNLRIQVEGGSDSRLARGNGAECSARFQEPFPRFFVNGKSVPDPIPGVELTVFTTASACIFVMSFRTISNDMVVLPYLFL